VAGPEGLHSWADVVRVDDTFGVAPPSVGRAVAGDEHDGVVPTGQGRGGVADAVGVDSGVGLLGREDHPFADVAGGVRGDRVPDAGRVGAEVGDENAVVGEGRGEVDPVPGVGEAGDVADRGAGRRDRQLGAGKHGPAQRQDVPDGRPGELERAGGAVGVQELPGPVGLGAPRPERHPRERGVGPVLHVEQVVRRLGLEVVGEQGEHPPERGMV